MFDEPLDVRSSRGNNHEKGLKFVDGRIQPKSFITLAVRGLSRLAGLFY